MVDFQQRDTRRGVEEFGLGSMDDSGEAGPDAPATDGTAERADHHAGDLKSVGVGVLTVSSSRTLEDDPAGDTVAAAVERTDHEVVFRELVGDSHDRVQGVVDTLVGREDVDLVVVTGGTGVSPDDVTIEAVRPLFEKELPGFGELFRRLSYDQIGTRAIATRAAAGIAEGVPVFCLPGSEAAARLGINDVILPEAGHLAGLARRVEDGEE